MSRIGSRSPEPNPGRKGREPEGNRGGQAFTFFRCLLWGLMMIATSLVLYGLSFALARSPLFAVKQVELEASGRPGPEEIRSVSGIRPGTSLLSLDTEDVSRRLESHPWIRNATVVKRLPDRVLIKVRETKPAVLVCVQGGFYYLDGEGKLLDRVPPGASLDFPIISGLEQDVAVARRCGKGRDVQQALSLLRALRAAPALGSVSEIHVDHSEGLSFVLEGFSVPVQVGWSGFVKRIARLEEALPWLGSHSNAIERVDLRFSGQIVVREREGGETQVPRGGKKETLAGSSPSFHPTT